MSFQELGLAPHILRAVAEEGYSTPTPIQSQAISQIIAGRDVQGCAQTGTGKTAAFALPILHRLTAAGTPPRGSGRRIRVLVLSPTRELAAQIDNSFTTYGRYTSLRTAVVFGGVNQRPQVARLHHGVDVLVATPGRLLDLMNQGFIDLSHVEIFVLDEADRMLDMGFLPDIRRVINKIPTQRQTLLFSATMPVEIAKLAEAILRDPVRINVAPVKATTALIEESVRFVPRKQKTEVLSQILQRRNVGRAIVFTRTKHGADRVAKQLHRAGIKADAIHGNKTQSSRQRILAGFKAGRTHVLVATDVASRGIDIDDVSHVFNYDLPHEPESYVHRIGRTGRAGATGFAVSLCDREERPLLAAIQKLVRRTLPVDAKASVEAAPTPRELNSTEAAPQPAGKRRKFNGAKSGHRPGGSSYSPHTGRPGNYPPRFPRKKKSRKALPTRQG